jgi:hypothetical protein
MKNRILISLIAVSSFAGLRGKAQVPIYSSYPSATAVLFLDFDGQWIVNTAWNTSGPFYCGDSKLNSTQITEVFNRVAEDYRPFNINVTTDSTKYNTAPATSRMRIVITDSSAWYGSAGGVSYVGSFTWGDGSPAFVFSVLLGLNTKQIGEAAAHEAGHTFGLYHQSVYDGSCNKLNEYNYGTGSGEIGWAPIMGVGYYENMTLWNNGPNSLGCSSIQSDLSVITTGNGFTYRPDDYPASFAGAFPLTISGNQFNINGVIEQNTDQDMFKFTLASSQHFNLSAVPYNVGTGDAGSDLDMAVSLYNNSQTLLNVFNPSLLLSSSIDTNLAAGTYYLKVEGKGNVYAPAYASLGSYSMLGTMSTVLPLHRLELHGSVVNDQHELTWLIDADEPVTKIIVEKSTDGRTFTPLTDAAVSARTYGYTPLDAGAVQYRLNVSFGDKQYYSNTITLRSHLTNIKPSLVSTLVSGNTVGVSSPGNFDYAIFDLHGSVIASGKLVNGYNAVSAGITSSGLYLIRYSNETGSWNDKFVKQ